MTEKRKEFCERKLKSDTKTGAKNRKLGIGIMIYFVIFFYVTRVVFSFCVAVSGSMEPTIQTGQHFIGNNFAYRNKTPERGDIINFKGFTKDAYCKRVIGIAGDAIEFHNGYVYLNGKMLDESEYLDCDMETNCLRTFVVPEGCVFVMGDNRENSYDSRYWEEPYVRIDDIQAKVILLLPF